MRKSRLESRVRENRTHGLEGGEVNSLLYPYQEMVRNPLARLGQQET